MIRIVNLRNYKLNANEVLIKVDRSSVLGNPFYMASETQRDFVCDKYAEYFSKRKDFEKQNMNIDGIDTTFIHKLIDIATEHLEHDIALGCWCYPKRCHAEVIKEYVERIQISYESEV